MKQKSFKLGAVSCRLVKKPMAKGYLRLLELARAYDDGSSSRDGLVWDGSHWREVDWALVKRGTSYRWRVSCLTLGQGYKWWYDWSLRGWLASRLNMYEANTTDAQINELAQALEKAAGLPVTEQETYLRPVFTGHETVENTWWRLTCCD